MEIDFFIMLTPSAHKSETGLMTDPGYATTGVVLLVMLVKCEFRWRKEPAQEWNLCNELVYGGGLEASFSKTGSSCPDDVSDKTKVTSDSQSQDCNGYTAIAFFTQRLLPVMLFSVTTRQNYHHLTPCGDTALYCYDNQTPPFLVRHPIQRGCLHG